MKQCEDYEAALHSDCNECDESCNYRKESSLMPLVILVSVIITLLIGSVTIYYLIKGLLT